MTLQAIETSYAGVTFRSRLEADWALNLDTWGFAWQYEPEGYELPGGVRYLPDFYLPEIRTWLEVKGPGVVGLGKTEMFARLVAHRPECRLHHRGGGIPATCGEGPACDYWREHEWECCGLGINPWQQVIIGGAPVGSGARFWGLRCKLELASLFRCPACLGMTVGSDTYRRCRACGHRRGFIDTDSVVIGGDPSIRTNGNTVLREATFARQRWLPGATR